jgi:3-oxoacyl-[acyl-carrier protein] reductase
MLESGEVAIITGASRGIGESIAKRLAEDGMITVLFGRDIQKLEKVATSIKGSGGEAIYYSGDAADEKFVNESIQSVLSKYKRIDHLINNAGVAVFKKFIDSNLDEFKLQVNTNVYGVYNFSRAVIGEMIKRRSGSIINIASLAGKNGFAMGTMYTATKHAVMGFTKSLMLEVREYNIRVAAVCPGSVSTEMIMNSALQPTDSSKILKPEDIAEVISAIIKLPPRALVSEIEIRPTNPK